MSLLYCLYQWIQVGVGVGLYFSRGRLSKCDHCQQLVAMIELRCRSKTDFRMIWKLSRIVMENHSMTSDQALTSARLYNLKKTISISGFNASVQTFQTECAPCGLNSSGGSKFDPVILNNIFACVRASQSVCYWWRTVCRHVYLLRKWVVAERCRF